MAARALLALGLAAFSQAIVLHRSIAQRVEENATRRLGEGDQENATSRGTQPCRCLAFADVYYSGAGFCGRGPELYFHTKHGFQDAYESIEPNTGVPHKVCYDLFMNLNSPVCVNMDLYPFPFKEHSGKQWCYVSNECQYLNGGGYATSDQGFAHAGWSNLEGTSLQAWKVCDQNRDVYEGLKTKHVQQVVTMGKRDDVPLSRLLRAAYPVVNISWGRAHYLMEAINEQYQFGRPLVEMVDAVPMVTDWGPQVEQDQARIREIVKSEQAVILDSLDHGDNFHIIQGRAAYSVKRRWNGNMIYLSGHFSKEFNVDCLYGCASGRFEGDEVDLETM